MTQNFKLGLQIYLYFAYKLCESNIGSHALDKFAKLNKKIYGRSRYWSRGSRIYRAVQSSTLYGSLTYLGKFNSSVRQSVRDQWNSFGRQPEKKRKSSSRHMISLRCFGGIIYIVLTHYQCATTIIQSTKMRGRKTDKNFTHLVEQTWL